MPKNNYFRKIDEFKKKIHLNDKLGLDDKDNIIMAMLQNNPSVSQEEIAKKVKLSQPSVGARIRKLQQKGIVTNISGVNFKVVDLKLAKIDIVAADPGSVIQTFKDCPFFINALVTSGKHNLCLFFMATDLKRLEGIVTHHLRKNPDVKDIEMNIVISASKDFVLPLNIDYDNKRQLECDQQCAECIID